MGKGFSVSEWKARSGVRLACEPKIVDRYDRAFIEGVGFPVQNINGKKIWNPNAVETKVVEGHLGQSDNIPVCKTGNGSDFDISLGQNSAIGVSKKGIQMKK